MRPLKLIRQFLTSPKGIASIFYFISLGAQAVRQGTFGEGIGTIWLHNTQCIGTEGSLTNCTGDFSGVNTCTHAQDAGIRCPPGNYYAQYCTGTTGQLLRPGFV